MSHFADNGQAIAHQISNRYLDEINKIPAEIVAEQVSRMAPKETLFAVARELEAAAHRRAFVGFDNLSSEAKALVAALLDFCGASRVSFADVGGPPRDSQPKNADSVNPTTVDHAAIADPETESRQVSLLPEPDSSAPKPGQRRKIGKR